MVDYIIGKFEFEFPAWLVQESKRLMALDTWERLAGAGMLERGEACLA